MCGGCEGPINKHGIRYPGQEASSGYSGINSALGGGPQYTASGPVMRAYAPKRKAYERGV